MINRHEGTDFFALDNEYVNGLATKWFFLNLIFNGEKPGFENKVIDPLIDCGLQLKRLLLVGGYTYLKPLNVCADEDLYFDIWLDADGDIQAGDLYIEEN